VGVRKLPRTPATFALTVAFTFLVFFAFNKQAFCNYYHFVIGALCCAIGAASEDSRSEFSDLGFGSPGHRSRKIM
jgi:hypothetical protein